MDSIYKDTFTADFIKEPEFLDFLRQREKNGVWTKRQTKAIRFEALEDDNIPHGYDADIINDTLKGTKLLMTTDEDAIPVRGCAIKSILERARISGNALNKVEKPILAQILNYCMQVASGDALLRFSEGKVSAVHGGDDSDYAILEIPELFRRTVEYLQEHFPGCTFAGGFYDHSMVTAIWELSANDELTETYANALAAHGITFKEIKPALRLTSSDVGVSGANLYPTLFAGKDSKTITLGSPLKLEHKNGASLERFDEQLAMVYSQYMLALNNLTALLDIEIDNPVNCMAGVCKRIGVTKKLALDAIELYTAQNGTGPNTAHAIYYAICSVIFALQCDGATGSRIAQMEENVARALSVRWRDYDVAGEMKW